MFRRPDKNFLPSAGKIKKMTFPKNIRCDIGYEEGNVVSIYYDSLLAKIISKGKNRNEAIQKIIKGLEVINIQGIQTNQDFLINILQTKEFYDQNLILILFLSITKRVLKEKLLIIEN